MSDGTGRRKGLSTVEASRVANEAKRSRLVCELGKGVTTHRDGWNWIIMDKGRRHYYPRISVGFLLRLLEICLHRRLDAETETTTHAFLRAFRDAFADMKQMVERLAMRGGER